NAVVASGLPFWGSNGGQFEFAFGLSNGDHYYVDNVEIGTGPMPTVGGVPGDYNGNGNVDAADYVLWRKGGPLQNEVDTPGTVNAADYPAWRARYGNPAGAGASLDSAAVPEPSTIMLIAAAVAGIFTF